VSYVLAVLGLAAACIVWFLIQKASGRLDEAECEGDPTHCDDCASRGERCPGSAPGDGEAPAHRDVRIF